MYVPPTLTPPAKLSILPTPCIYVFHMNFTINRRYFSEQHEPTGLRKGDSECLELLKGRHWSFMYY
jgi:hypothetical protein